MGPNTLDPFVVVDCESSFGSLPATVGDDDLFLVGALAGAEVSDDLDVVGVLGDIPLPVPLA